MKSPLTDPLFGDILFTTHSYVGNAIFNPSGSDRITIHVGENSTGVLTYATTKPTETENPHAFDGLVETSPTFARTRPAIKRYNRMLTIVKSWSLADLRRFLSDVQPGAQDFLDVHDHRLDALQISAGIDYIDRPEDLDLVRVQFDLDDDLQDYAQRDKHYPQLHAGLFVEVYARDLHAAAALLYDVLRDQPLMPEPSV